MAPASIRIETVVKALTYAVCLLAFGMVATAVGPVYSALFLGLAALSLMFERRAVFVIPRWLLNLLAVLFVGMTALRVSFADPVTPVLQMLLVLLAIKLLEEKGFRDFMQIYLLAVFLLAGSALVSIDMDFLAALIVLMFLLSTAIILLTYYIQDRSLELSRPVMRRLLTTSLLIPAIAIPMSILLFLVMPRSTFPLMTFLNRGGGASTGFSEQVALGDISAIQEDASIAFRVEIPRIDDSDLYWRGIVLDTFDGRAWTRSPDQTGAGELKGVRGRMIRQMVYLEPYQNRYLFALDRPLSVSHRQANVTQDRTVTLPGVFERRIRYEAVSLLVPEIAERAVPHKRYVQLPERSWDPVHELVRAVAGNAGGIEAAAAMEQWFRSSGNFRYTLTALTKSDDPVTAFLLETRAGNCEYFASAMAVMLRLEGIPARLVGGYRGGYYSELGGYYAVTQKSAHVWVEAYFPDRGWVRFDPTPGSDEGFTAALERGLLFKTRMLLDSIQYFWNAFVINYDFEKQVGILRGLQKSLRGLDLNLAPNRTTLAWLGAVALLIVLVAATFRYIRVRKKTEQRMLDEYLAVLKRHGYTRGAGEGLTEMAARISEVSLRHDAERFVGQFHRAVYRDGAFRAEVLRELRQKLNKLKEKQ